MSDETETKNEKILTKLKNTQNNEEIDLEMTRDNADKFKRFIENTKDELVRANKIITDKEVESKQLPTGGTTALLGREQIEGSTLPLNSNDGLPLDMCQFKDEHDMLVTVEREVAKKNPEAQKVLSQLYSKATEKSWTYDYNGDPRDLVRKLPKDPKEREELIKKRQMWEKVK